MYGTTPYNQLPITIVMKAMRQKVYRQAHCLECGWPYADITDKVVAMFDGETQLDTYLPDQFGMVELHCPNRACRQYYRLEFAI